MSKDKTVEVAGRSGNVETYGKYFKDKYELSGSPKGYDLEKIFNDPQEHIGDIICLAKYYYAKVGIIMRVVNIMRDFTIGKPKFCYPTKNKRAKAVIEAFNERVGIGEVLRDIIYELGLTGNCAGYDRDGKRIDIYPISKIKVSDLIVGKKPVLMYKNDLGFSAGDFSTNKKLVKQLSLAYPKEIVKGLRNNEDEIILDIENSFFLKVNSSRYEPYGISHLVPAFDELAHKNVLKEAERSTANGIIDKILQTKVGNKDHKPKQPEIDYYHSLTDGKKGSLRVTTPYFVEYQYVEPSTDIFGKEKFEQVDTDLLNAMGISLTLIRGEGGGNYSEGVISLTGLIKTCENLRAGVPAIVREWHMRELKRNGIKPEYAPTMELEKVEIDTASKMQMLQWLFSNAGLPYEVLYKEAGFDYLSVKLIREAENEEKAEDTFKLREQPFQGKGMVGANNGGGSPTKNQNERKTDKSKSNNENPRTS